LLARAIARHAWTFAGSGCFTVQAGPPLVLETAGCPLARGATADAPVCECYAATFEGVFRALVRRARVEDIACVATSAPACRFVVGW
jgi:divinyl protochlorophyllide a 8-vinyl-reductase